MGLSALGFPESPFGFGAAFRGELLLNFALELLKAFNREFVFGLASHRETHLDGIVDGLEFFVGAFA